MLITIAPVEEWAEGYLGVKVMRAGQQAFSGKVSPAAPGIRTDNALFTNQLLQPLYQLSEGADPRKEHSAKEEITPPQTSTFFLFTFCFCNVSVAK